MGQKKRGTTPFFINLKPKTKNMNYLKVEVNLVDSCIKNKNHTNLYVKSMPKI